MENYYDILNISRNADGEEIKRAFRTLAMKYHPDKNPESKTAEDKFKKVNEAYSVLSDPVKKRAYDSDLNYRPYGETGRGSYGAGRYSREPFGEDIFTEEDIFNGTGFDFGTFTWSSSKREKKEEQLSRKEAVSELIMGILYIAVGILLLHSFVFLGIFGLILTFSLVSSGIRKIKRSYAAVFK